MAIADRGQAAADQKLLMALVALALALALLVMIAVVVVVAVIGAMTKLLVVTTSVGMVAVMAAALVSK